MNWTSIYLKTSDLNVFILGTGEVAIRRANNFLNHGACVKLVGNYLDEDIKSKGAILCSSDDIENLVSWADLVVIASGDEKLSDYVSDISGDKLINRADFPDKGNVMVPSSFQIGDVEISIFTNAKSPLMARQLRKKIQSIITEEDILKIEIQDYTRLKLKKTISDQKIRKKYLYKIFEDDYVNDLIYNKKIDDAKEYIDKLIGDFDDT